MKCEVCEGHYRFFPQLIFHNLQYYDLSHISSDKRIAEFLGLEFKKYTNLIIENKGFLNEGYFFNTEKECQEFIEKVIEPRLVMKKLTE